MGRAISFAMVANRAGASCIAPGVLPSPATGDEMVNRKVTPVQHPTTLRLTSLNTTVNAAITIALQYPPTTPTRSSAGYVDVASQPDDGWDVECV